MSYSKDQIIKMCEKAAETMSGFYNAGFVNYGGTTKDGPFYTEVVSEWLLNNDNLKKFDTIRTITRTSSYRIVSHNGEIARRTNRLEEITAKELFKVEGELNFIGRIIDYQTPLKNKQSDSSGKIDLLSINDKEKIVYILELKKKDSKDTMLKCVLESYTYLRIVDQEKLLKDFNIDPSSFKVKAAPFVYKDSAQYDEYKNKENHPFLHELMNKLDIKPFFIEEKKQFIVSE